MMIRQSKERAGIACGMLAAGCMLTLQQTAAGESPADDRSPWGVASSFEWFEEYPRFNPVIREAGATWFRYFPDWSQVQPAKDRWRWDLGDALKVDLRKNGLRQLGILAYAAPWATTDGTGRTVPLKDNDDWARYVETTVGRYRDDIGYWEIWNEFNSDVFAHAPRAEKPKIYADLVKAAHSAAKKASPEVKLGLPMANFDVAFLDATIKQGAKGHFDFISVHPYENLATVVTDGGEMGFLSLAGSLRKMLRENGQDENLPLWISEIGFQSTSRPDAVRDKLQAEALVLCHVLSLAQGFDKVFWFEARGPSYGKSTDYGLIRHDWSRRPAWHAYQSMTGLLGRRPEYLGWLNPGGEGYGFVFQGAAGPVLVCWTPHGRGEVPVSFGKGVVAKDLMGKDIPVGAAGNFTLQRAPSYVSGLPDPMVQEAKANRGRPFPWAKDYSRTDVARVMPGAANREDGVRMLNAETHSEVVHGLDWSARKSRNHQGGDKHYLYFRVDPSFAGFGDTDLEITIEARRHDPEKAVTLKLLYEGTDGYRQADESFPIPGGSDWAKKTWRLNRANFVGGWGWNFRLDASGSPGEYQIREVKVQKVGPNR